MLCVALRQYKLLIQGLGLILIMITSAAIFQPQALSNSVSGFTSNVIYKGFRERDVLASRKSPWTEALNTISTHFWFGTGFGTKDLALDSTLTTASFTSNSVAVEYGSSYLAVMVWVGLIGALPFLLLLILLVDKIVRTFRWMRSTGSALHPAVPFALVVVAGLVHAGFEDWMFAVGYYLCVFFWSMAFLLVDLAPEPYRGASLSLHSSSRPWQSTRQILVSGAELGQPLG
jgi:O-antigen ligase